MKLNEWREEVSTWKWKTLSCYTWHLCYKGCTCDKYNFTGFRLRVLVKTGHQRPCHIHFMYNYRQSSVNTCSYHIKYRAFHNVLCDYKNLKQENQRTYLNGIFHSHKKTEKVFFWQLKMFNVWTTGDTAHINTIFKLLPHTRHHIILYYITLYYTYHCMWK